MKKILGALAVGLTLCVVCLSGTSMGENLTTGLVSYWKLDGNSIDAVGSAHGTDANITYGPSYGMIGSGADFNGTSSSITIGTAVNAAIAGNHTITIWFNADSVANDPWFLAIDNNSGIRGPRFGAISPKKLKTESQEGAFNTEETFELDTWNFACYVYDGSDHHMYLNGSLSAASGAFGAFSNSNISATFGRRLYPTAEQWFNGSLDEVGIWSRALSPTEISILYNSGDGFQYPFETPTPTPTNTPTPTPTPTQTPTHTNTPDIVPPAAPVISDFRYGSSGEIKEICGTASGDTATVEVFDGALSLGTAGPTPQPYPEWCITLSTPIPSGPHSLRALARDASGQNDGSVSDDYGVTQSVAVNAHQETDPLLTHSGSGVSLRLEKTGAQEFKLSVNGSAPVTVTAWLRKNTDYSGTAPKLTLTGLGITGTGAATVSMAGGPDTWEELTVSGTPGAKGVVTLKVETFSAANGAAAWVDDVSVSQ